MLGFCFALLLFLKNEPEEEGDWNEGRKCGREVQNALNQMVLELAEGGEGVEEVLDVGAAFGGVFVFEGGGENFGIGGEGLEEDFEGGDLFGEGFGPGEFFGCGR